MKLIIAMHQTFEKDADDMRQRIVYFSDGVDTLRFEEKSKKFEKFLELLPKKKIR